MHRRQGRDETIEQSFDIFIRAKSLDGTAPATLDGFYKVFSRLIGWAETVGITEDCKVSMLTESTIDGYLMHLAGTCKNSPATVEMHRATLSSIFKWMLEMKLVKKNPVNLPCLSQPKEPKTPFSRDEFDSLLSAAASAHQWYWGAAITIGWHTGLRLRDVSTLRRPSVDMTTETIRLVPAKTKKKGIVVEIPIEPIELFPVLETLFARPQGKPAPWMPDDFLLPDMALKYTRSQAQLSNEFAAIRDAAGVAGNGRGFHHLRSSFSSRMMNSGTDALVTASMTGHTNLQTLKGYVKVSPQAKRAALHKAMKADFGGE